MEEIQKTGFFEDSPGVKSSTRLMAFLALLAALLIAISVVFIANVSIGDGLPLVITLLAYSAGVKTFQVFAENMGKFSKT